MGVFMPILFLKKETGSKPYPQVKFRTKIILKKRTKTTKLTLKKWTKMAKLTLKKRIKTHELILKKWIK